MKKILIVILGVCLMLDYYVSSKLQMSEKVVHAQKTLQAKMQKSRSVQALSLTRT